MIGHDVGIVLFKAMTTLHFSSNVARYTVEIAHRTINRKKENAYGGRHLLLS
jgi:hypothetical protein